MGTEGADEAAAGLRLISQHLREPLRSGPAERRPAGVRPTAPLNIDIVDHIDRCVAEAAEHVRMVAPEADGPRPERVDAIYQWWHERTADAAPEVQLRRDIVIYRQHLEHSIALREYKVIRHHPCPGCRTWGLMWQQSMRRALCPNLNCRDAHGMTRTWSLARLATAHVMAERARDRRAT